jgi:hypothetical protein
MLTANNLQAGSMDGVEPWIAPRKKMWVLSWPLASYRFCGALQSQFVCGIFGVQIRPTKEVNVTSLARSFN